MTRPRTAIFLVSIGVAGTACFSSSGSSPSTSGAAWYGNPGAMPTPASNGPEGDFPDLTVDQSMLFNSISFGHELRPASDCAVVEGCIVGDQSRRVLRFDVGVMNKGTVDLHVGNPADNPNDFEYSACHGHYHFKGFAQYVLTGSNGIVATGAKRAFCLMDINKWSQNSGPANGVYDCNDQGISVGWEDVYDKSLDCQWVDITDVAPGHYTLSVTVNAENRLPEKGPAPNTVSVPVTIAP